MATPDNRFQVSHILEGFISGHRTLTAAINAGKRWDRKDTGYVCEPFVFDQMAHVGQPCEYDLNGDVVLYKVEGK